MAAITSPGIGSGLDINSLVSQLVAAERGPKENLLNFKEATAQAEISAYGTLKSAISTFSSALVLQSLQSTFQAVNATSSDTTILTATANSKAVDGVYNIVVSSLADAHSVASTGFTNTTDVVGVGTLTFKFGTTSFTTGPFTYTGFVQNANKATQTVTIDSTNNTLEGIRDAVNTANIGVTASIINNGTTNQLVFSSGESGAANSLEITVADLSDASDTDTSGLSQLAFNASAVNLTQTVVAADASLTINGLAITSKSNKFSDALTGVTLDLIKADATQTVKLTVANDVDTTANVVRNFVQDYNALLTTINELSAYNTGTQQGSILTSDSTVRNIVSQLRKVLNDKTVGLTGSLTSLAEIGVVTERDGTLKVDDGKLDTAIKNNPGSVSFLFAAAGKVSSSQVEFVSSGNNSQPGDYKIDITQAATQGDLTGIDFGYDSATPITIDDTNKSLAFKVDGVDTGTLTLTKANYTGAQLAVELQTRINGSSALSSQGVSVTVTFDETSTSNEHFIITSARYGDASKVIVTSSAGNNFGLIGTTATTGLNVAGTIGGQFATGSGQVLTGSATTADLAVKILDSSTGDHGTINFTRGVADRIHSFLGNYLDSKGSIDGKIKGAESEVKRIGVDRENLDIRMASIEQRIRSQFIAMDQLVAQLQTTSSFLTQQLASLPKISVRSSRR